jgi:hypothetical protein
MLEGWTVVQPRSSRKPPALSSRRDLRRSAGAVRGPPGAFFNADRACRSPRPGAHRALRRVAGTRRPSTGDGLHQASSWAMTPAKPPVTGSFLQSLRESTRSRVSVEFIGGEQGDGTNAFGPHERFLDPGEVRVPRARDLRGRRGHDDARASTSPSLWALRRLVQRGARGEARLPHAAPEKYKGTEMAARTSTIRARTGRA